MTLGPPVTVAWVSNCDSVDEETGGGGGKKVSDGSDAGIFWPVSQLFGERAFALHLLRDILRTLERGSSGTGRDSEQCNNSGLEEVTGMYTVVGFVFESPSSLNAPGLVELGLGQGSVS